MNNNRVSKIFVMLGDVFNPMIPAFVISGLSAGIATLLKQVVVLEGSRNYLYAFYLMLILVNKSFTMLMPAFIGFYSAQIAGSRTPLLGAILGMATGLAEIDFIAETIGVSSFVTAGTGGVVAAFIGSFCIAKLENKIHDVMPKSFDIVFTPLISFFIVMIPFLVIIMPFAGFISNFLCFIIEKLSTFESLILRLISGFICGFVFLPINICGLQHGIIALYPIELEKVGYITLYPVFAMAGASQVGVGFAIYVLSKKVKNNSLAQISMSSLIPGMMGIATPLIYGVTLPYPKAFIASCFGAGIGGALMITVGIVSIGWGPSGLLAIPIMQIPGESVINSMLIYIIVWCITVVAGFILGLASIRKESLIEINN